ncbi:MAG TPA: hypothetical protein VIH59_07140 [Candidatus Tectomicrobia bacterium]|jgi:CO/xanthine dehydrogenase Mo-binding subunit
MTYCIVGKAPGRVEGPAQVSGQATYAAEVLLPGMVWGKTLTATAIANAVYDAVGVRLCELPSNAKKLSNALHTRQQTLPLAPQTP